MMTYQDDYYDDYTDDFAAEDASMRQDDTGVEAGCCEPYPNGAVRRIQEGQEAFGGCRTNWTNGAYGARRWRNRANRANGRDQEIREPMERLGRLGLAVLPEQQGLPAHPA